MTEIKYKDEADLQRKIVKIFNTSGYQFEKAPSPYFCDIFDKIRKIYLEVKPEHFAPAQLLYGIAKEGIKDENLRNVKYIGLACSYEVRFYKAPAYDIILNFAKKIDPEFSTPPSNIQAQQLHNEAFKLLGDHWKIYTYSGELNLD